MHQLGFVPQWQFGTVVADNPALVNMAFPPGMTQTTVQPVGPYYWQGGLGGPRGALNGSPLGLLPPSMQVLAIGVSTLAMFYHGIKRNSGSIGWGLGWGLLGFLFPLLTPIASVAMKPGFAKAK